MIKIKSKKKNIFGKSKWIYLSIKIRVYIVEKSFTKFNKVILRKIKEYKYMYFNL